MYAFISGIADTEGVDYCPFCGEEIKSYYGDATCYCDKCERRFAVIETDEGD